MCPDLIAALSRASSSCRIISVADCAGGLVIGWQELLYVTNVKDISVSHQHPIHADAGICAFIAGMPRLRVGYRECSCAAETLPSQIMSGVLSHTALDYCLPQARPYRRCLYLPRSVSYILDSVRRTGRHGKLKLTFITELAGFKRHLDQFCGIYLAAGLGKADPAVLNHP